MRTTFYELINTFAAKSGCTANVKEGTCTGSLIVEGLEFHLGLMESSGMLLINTGVALLPSEGREEFYEYLLTANDLFSGTKGLTLGVNKEQELVTLQLAWELGKLDEERFGNLMANMGILAAEWIMKLDAWRPEAPSFAASADPSLDFMNFLRV